MRTVLAAAAMLASCSLSLVTAWSTHAEIGLVARTGNATVAVPCDVEADDVRLWLRVRGTAGELRIRLLDPAGACAFDETLCGGERVGSLTLPPRVGTWRCELGYTGFSGDCEVELRADGGSLHGDAAR